MESDEWVYIVRHSATLHYQTVSPAPPRRKSKGSTLKRNFRRVAKATKIVLKFVYTVLV